MKKFLLIVTVIALAIVANEILSWLFLLVGAGLFFGKMYKEAENGK